LMQADVGPAVSINERRHLYSIPLNADNSRQPALHSDSKQVGQLSLK